MNYRQSQQPGVKKSPQNPALAQELQVKYLSANNASAAVSKIRACMQVKEGMLLCMKHITDISSWCQCPCGQTAGANMQTGPHISGRCPVCEGARDAIRQRIFNVMLWQLSQAKNNRNQSRARAALVGEFLVACSPGLFLVQHSAQSKQDRGATNTEGIRRGAKALTPRWGEIMWQMAGSPCG